MTRYQHLDSRILHLLEKSDRERVNYILGERFIPYQLAEEVLTEVEDILEQDPSQRPKCELIAGEPGSGKTMILNEAIRLFSSRGEPIRSTGRTTVPFVAITLPAMLDIRPLYGRALTELGIPHDIDHKPARLHEQTIAGLADAGTRLLGLDEIHNLMSTKSKLEDAMIALRDITNHGVALLAAGTSLAGNVIDADEQLKIRFRRHYLGRWCLGNELRDFLATLESRLPLRKASGLHREEIMKLIVRLSGGHLGIIVTCVREAARSAVRDGTEKLDEAAIENSMKRLMSQGYAALA